MNKFKKTRLEKGYTVLGLSRATGVSRETINRIESGRAKRINDLTIYRLAKVLGDLDEKH